MLHELIKTWFNWVENWGYLGVFLLMALESSIVPVPSEIVMPPAAYWAAQGRMSFSGVVLAGTLGSLFGSLASYYGAQLLGLPFIQKFGKYVLLPANKIELAENFVKENGAFGVFFARLLPVLRHLVSIPAGIFKMDIKKFTLVTTVGGGLWCFILAWFGEKVLGEDPTLLASPERMAHVIKAKLAYIVAGILVVGVLYFFAIQRPMQKRKITA